MYIEMSAKVDVLTQKIEEQNQTISKLIEIIHKERKVKSKSSKHVHKVEKKKSMKQKQIVRFYQNMNNAPAPEKIPEQNNGRTIYTGPRGGRYYYNSNGNISYSN